MAVKLNKEENQTKKKDQAADSKSGKTDSGGKDKDKINQHNDDGKSKARSSGRRPRSRTASGDEDKGVRRLKAPEKLSLEWNEEVHGSLATIVLGTDFDTSSWEKEHESWVEAVSAATTQPQLSKVMATNKIPRITSSKKSANAEKNIKWMLRIKE